MVDKYKKILVTGGAGFIGSHIVDKLLKDGFTVTAIDNLSTGRTENITRHQTTKEFNFVKCDIRDRSLVKKQMKDIDAVFHEAALASVTSSVKDPILTNEVNVTGTLNLLTAASDLGVKRFIFASSAAVYGNTCSPLKKETDVPKPTSPYGVSKLTAEHYARIFYNLYGLKTTCLRYFNVFGPRQNVNIHGGYGGVISIFINRLLNGLPPIINGDGGQTRDFVYVEDIVDANLLALDTINAVGETFNIATGKNVSINYLAEVLKELTNRKNLENLYVDPRPTDIRHGYADISKARKLLDYVPKFSIEDGLTNLVNWYTDNSRHLQNQ